MLQANQNQALLPSEKPRPSPSKPPLRRYAAFTPKAGERLPGTDTPQSTDTLAQTISTKSQQRGGMVDIRA